MTNNIPEEVLRVVAKNTFKRLCLLNIKKNTYILWANDESYAGNDFDAFISKIRDTEVTDSEKDSYFEKANFKQILSMMGTYNAYHYEYTTSFGRREVILSWLNDEKEDLVIALRDVSKNNDVSSLISAFSSNYFATWNVDLKTNKLEVIHDTKYYETFPKRVQGNAIESFKHLSLNAYDKENQELISTFFNFETIKNALINEDSSAILFHHISNGWIKAEISVTEKDEEGFPSTILVTFKERNDEINREESLSYELKKNELLNEVISSGPWTFTFDKFGQIDKINWSDKFKNLLGFENEEEFPNVLESWSDRLHPEDKGNVIRHLLKSIRDKSNSFPYDLEFRVRKKNDEYGWFKVNSRITRDQNGMPTLMAGTFIDVTEEHLKNEEKLAELHRFYETQKLAMLGTWYLESENNENYLHMNPTMMKIFALNPDLTPKECYDEWLTRVDSEWKNNILNAFYSMGHGKQLENIYLWNHPTMGNVYIRYGGYKDDTYSGTGYRVAGYHQIVNESVKREMELRDRLEKALDSYKQADYDKRRDYLTGLNNRLDMFEFLNDTLSTKKDSIKSMFMMDIDNFKMLNDTYGHLRGDECLKAIGEAVRAYGRENDMRFYRYGGEEILGISFSNSHTIERTAQELLDVVYNLNFQREDTIYKRVTVSVGASSYDSDFNVMIDRADKAMYKAKADGKNRYVIFEDMD